MTWRDVLRRDLRSTYRSRMAPAIAAVLLLGTVGAVSLMVVLSRPDHPPGMESAVLVLGSVLSFLVPATALVGSYGAIVGERTSGSVRFLLGLPNTREGVFLGKFLSRLAAVLAPLAVGVVGSGAVVVLYFRDGAFAPLLLLGALSVAYAALFVGLGLSASTLGNSDVQSVALAFGALALFRVGWPAAQWAGLQGVENPFPRPEWYFWVGRSNPMNAFVRATTALADVEYHPLLTTSRGVENLAVSLEFALAVLAVWTVVAPVAGFVYFRRRDLQ